MLIPPELPGTVDEVFALLRYPWAPPSLLPEAIANSFRTALAAVAHDFKSRMNSYAGYQVGSEISPNRRSGACDEMHIPQSETVVALYDDSMFGNGKVGIVFGENAIYWKLGWQAVGSEKGPFRIDYCQLQRLPIYWYTSPETAYIGNPFRRMTFMTKQNSRAIHDMLIEIQNAVLHACGTTSLD